MNKSVSEIDFAENYSIIHWQYMPGYANENVKLRNIFSESLANLYYKILSPKTYQHNISALIKDCKEFIGSILYRSSTSNDAVASLYAIRTANRVELIVRKLESGCSIVDAFAPYAVKDNAYAYANPNLYIECENTIKKDCIIQSLKYLSSNPKISILDIDAITYLYFPCDEYSQLLTFLLKNNQFYRSNFTQLLSKLPTDNMQTLLSGLLDQQDQLEILIQYNLLTQLLTFITERKNLCQLLLEKPQILMKPMHHLPIKDLVGFFDKLSLDQENPVVAKAKLDSSRDFFKALLMHDLDYTIIIHKLLSEFAQYRSQARMVVYESLLRGDIPTVKRMLEASNEHEINRRELTTKNKVSSFFDKQKQVDHKELISFSDSIGFNLTEFITYMTQKYNLAKDGKELFFIKNVVNFANTLEDLQFISNKQEFLIGICKRFSLEIPTNMEGTKDTENGNNLLEEINNLKKENVQLTKKVESLESLLVDVVNYLKRKDTDFDTENTKIFRRM